MKKGKQKKKLRMMFEFARFIILLFLYNLKYSMNVDILSGTNIF
jgi:hypothetical protein